MRVSKETMELHHQQIVSTASEMLRERGVQGVSLADVMQAVGLTHGGFYRHFTSKEALVAEATNAAFEGILARLEKLAARKGSTTALEDYVSGYLSQKHLDKPSQGCPIPAFGGNIAHEGAEIRAAFHTGVTRLLAWVEAGLPLPVAERKAKAVELLSLMVGAVVTARASGDKAMARQILAQARHSVSSLAQLSLR